MKTAQQFFHQLIMLYRPFENGLNKELKKHQLHRAEWTILFYLYNYGPSTSVNISQYLSVEKPTVTRTLNSLEKLNYVQRTVGKDRREKYMQLTETGIKAYEAARVSIDRFEEEILKGFSEEEQKQMIQMMQHIRNNIVQ